MPDTRIDYQGVADGAQALERIRNQFDELTSRLQQKIQNLINNGGFTTDVGSSALGQAFTRFMQAKDNAMKALKAMIDYLKSIPEMYQQADNQYRSIFERYQPG